MKTNRLYRALRASALVVLIAGFSTWAAAGARLGWTQTSTLTLQHDEITGIEYPVRQAAFLPGIEFPLLATATAATFAGIAWLMRPRLSARA